MFKIPTYEDLENKEKELNKERKGYCSNLFLKRKVNESDEDTVKIDNNQKKTTTESEIKQTEPVKPAEERKSIEIKSIPTSIVVDGDDDDDDEDLLNFINDNKDIIEKPVQKTDDFIKPIVPDVKKVESVNSFKNHNASNVPTTSSTNTMASGSLTVSSKQRGNLVLKHIKNVPWKYCDQLTPDYQMGKRTCGFYLSMKYHLLNPTYIHKRIKELGRAYDVRILLCLVDVKEPHHCIKELEKISIFANLTMILCWSNEEVARYLETYKAYEYKSAEAIMEKATVTVTTNVTNASNSDANFINTFTDFLCQIKSVNKTDASTLRQTFGSVKQLTMASKDELNLCPGLGPLKVNRIYEIFRTPFLNNNAKKQ